MSKFGKGSIAAEAKRESKWAARVYRYEPSAKRQDANKNLFNALKLQGDYRNEPTMRTNNNDSC